MVVNFFQKIEYSALKIIEKLENQKITLTTWLISFFSIVFLRILLESFSSRFNFFQRYIFVFHLSLFFLLCALIITLFLYFLTREKIEKITKIVLFASLIILLPPIADLIVTGGQGGIYMQYLQFLKPPSGVLEFFQFFFKSFIYGAQGILFSGQENPLFGPNPFEVNYGIRIQFTIIYLGFIWYVFLKTRNILKVLLGLISIYFVLFTLGTLPLNLYKISSSFNPSFDHHHVIFSLYFILVCILASFWFYIQNKEKCLALFKNFRLFRTIQNIAMLGLGLYLAKVPFFNLNFQDWVLIIIAVISVCLYWLSAIGYNDLSDEKIDRISNPSRPLCQGKLTREEFKTLSNVFLIASYISALVAGYFFFIFIFLRSLLGYLYNAFPFRLRRFPILASFTKALAYLFTIYAGFLLNPANKIFDFPRELSLFLLLAFTLGVNVKDIKDYEGDKAGGVYTIPVIFGLERGKKIVAFLALIPFILCPLFFFDYFKTLIFPSILSGILIFWLINKKKYSEKPLFLVYFSYGLFLVLNIFKP